MTGPRRYRVTEAYRSPYPEPILFRKGEAVTVGREFNDDPDWQGWVWCEGERGNAAWVPKEYLAMQADRGTLLTNYNAMELSLAAGEVLEVYEIVNGFGMVHKPDGARGWAPIRNLEPIP